MITYPVCPGQYGEYGGYDFLLIKVCLLYGKCSSSLWPKLITMKVIVILTTTIMKMTKLSEGGGNDVCQIGCLSSFGLVSALGPIYRRLRKVDQCHHENHHHHHIMNMTLNIEVNVHSTRYRRVPCETNAHGPHVYEYCKVTQI